MGDKSPKSKQRNQAQKSAAKLEVKKNQATRQASYAVGATKEKKK